MHKCDDVHTTTSVQSSLNEVPSLTGRFTRNRWTDVKTTITTMTTNKQTSKQTKATATKKVTTTKKATTKTKSKNPWK